MAPQDKSQERREEERKGVHSGERYGYWRGYGNDTGEGERQAREGHGAHPEPPREKGDEAFEEEP